MTYVFGQIKNPEALGGLAAVITLAGFLVRTSLKNITQDRGAGFLLATERQAEIDDLRTEVSELRTAVDEQRALKHVNVNELAVCHMLLDTVRRMAPNCTCGALRDIAPLLERRDGDSHMNRRDED